MKYENELFNDFVCTFESTLDKKEIAGIVSSFIHWKQNILAARWKEDFFPNGKCPKCGGSKLVHFDAEWEGRKTGWHICPSIWTTDCHDCNTRFINVSNDDGELLDGWTEELDS